MNILKRIETYLIAYVVAGIVTFGHAFHNINGLGGDKAAGAMISMIMWPLYVSVQAWK